MSRITTITNQKGGVGKTTTSNALANALFLNKYKVLLIDMDPQANASYIMNVHEAKLNIYHVLKGEIKIEDAICKTEQCDILPSGILLAGADLEFSKTGREFILSDCLKSIKEKYDYIIIDTPPTLGILTINALTASNDVIIPMAADIFSLQGLSQLCITIEGVRKYCNPNLKISGILITRHNNRTILTKDLLEVIENKSKQIDIRVFETIIREGIAIRESQAQQNQIYKNLEKNNPAKDYLNFAKEYIKNL